jgi:hypothetical protein
MKIVKNDVFYRYFKVKAPSRFELEYTDLQSGDPPPAPDHSLLLTLIYR